MCLRCICKCRLENYTFDDWTAHWKYGLPKPQFLGQYPKLRAIYLFLFTKLEFVK